MHINISLASNVTNELVVGWCITENEIQLGISIPSSMLLPASLFTRSIIHHLVTNSLVICLQAYDVYYREGPEIPLRYSEWQILMLIYANPTNTFGDTCRASLWSSSYVVTFDSTQGIPPVSGSCTISWSKEMILDIRKALSKRTTRPLCYA